MTASPSWLNCPAVESLDEAGQAAFDGLRRGDGSVHNLYKPFALWPTPLRATDQLYRDLVHAPDGPLSLAEREFVATQVALLTDCTYAASHHGANFKTFWGDEAEAEALLEGLRHQRYDAPLFDGRRKAMATYGAKLTRHPGAMTADDLQPLRDAGLSEAEILHLNQVSANFNYWVRTINGLGISLGEEAIGLDAAGIERLRAANAAANR